MKTKVRKKTRGLYRAVRHGILIAKLVWETLQQNAWLE